MELRNVGRSGLRVSVLGLGCNAFGMRCDAGETSRIVSAAIDAGINFFDTADSYGDGRSEEFLGKALAGKRDQLVVATKFGWPLGQGREGASCRYIHQAVEASLKRLGTDWIDLYQLHRPDPNTPIEETITTLEDLRRQGKIRYYGCSNFSGLQITEAALTAKLLGAEGFISTQTEYSLLSRKAKSDLLPYLSKYGMSLLPYFPLASGLLTGKYKPGKLPEKSRLTDPNTPWLEREANRWLTPETLSLVAALDGFAAQGGLDLLSLALAWLASHREIASVIAGATAPEQVRTNADAVSHRLSDQQLAELESLISNIT